MLKIGEFSKLGQVSPKTLRLYDERGLLRPSYIDRFTGYRYYAPAVLARLHRILALKDLGFTLDQIGELLEEEQNPSDLAGMMRERLRSLSRHIAAEEARMLRVEARLQQLESSADVPAYDVVVKPAKPLSVLGRRQVLPHRQGLPVLVADFRDELRRQKLPWNEPLLGIYYDHAFRERGLDVELALPLEADPGDATGLARHELPGSEMMACAIHRGPLSGLSSAYEAVLTWADAGGYRTSGPNRDLFLNESGTEEAAVTEVQFPIEPRPYLTSVAKAKDKKKMEPIIEKKEAFTVVGLPYRGQAEGNNEIPELWETWNRRASEVQNISGPAFGLCKEVDSHGDFDYLAGMRVSNAEDLPEGMTSWNVPEATYAVFPAELPKIHEAWDYAYLTWLPQSNFERESGIAFELYEDDFNPDTGEVTMYVCIPVRGK